MGINPIIRTVLIISALSIFIRHDYGHLIASLIIEIFLYIVIRQWKLLLVVATPLAFFTLSVIVIWFIVFIDFKNPAFVYTFWKVFDESSPFFSYIRVIPIALLIILVFRTIPDGQLHPTLIRMGLSKNIALIVASAESSFPLLRDSFYRSRTALRAQGIISLSRWSSFVHLPDIVSLTLVSCWNSQEARNNIKWVENGFYEKQETYAETAPIRYSFYDSLFAIICAMAIPIVNIIEIPLSNQNVFDFLRRAFILWQI